VEIKKVIAEYRGRKKRKLRHKQTTTLFRKSTLSLLADEQRMKQSRITMCRLEDNLDLIG